jgi:NitT/TauT family transport system substrate-binding protein
VLKLSSSAPIFLGVERGTFSEFGIEPELVYFQAAQPVAVAIAAGEVEVGATGLTAGSTTSSPGARRSGSSPTRAASGRGTR